MSYKMVNVFVYLFVSLFVTDCESLTNFFYYSLCNRQDTKVKFTVTQVNSSFIIILVSALPEEAAPWRCYIKKVFCKISQTHAVFFQESCKIRLPEACKR